MQRNLKISETKSYKFNMFKLYCNENDSHLELYMFYLKRQLFLRLHRIPRYFTKLKESKLIIREEKIYKL